MGRDNSRDIEPIRKGRAIAQFEMTWDETFHELGLEDRASEGQLLAECERLTALYEELVRARASSGPYRASEVAEPRATLEVLFQLHEGARAPQARRLQRALADWLSSTRHDARAMGAVPAAWELARALGALPDELSFEVRRALAWGARTGNFATMEAALRAFGAVDRRSLADSALVGSSGGPFAPYAGLLGDPDALERARGSLGSGRAIVVGAGALGAFAVGLILMGSEGRSSVQGATPGPAAAAAAGGGGSAEQAGEAVARLRGNIGNGPLDSEARAIGRALVDHDCKAALEHVATMTSGGPYPQTQLLVDAVAVAVRRACKVDAAPVHSPSHA
jgi:hypothetical protein